MRQLGILFIFITLVFSASCGPAPTPILIYLPTGTATSTVLTETPQPAPVVTTVVPLTDHLMTPAAVTPLPGHLVYDVESARRAAPYGDSYKVNLLERPFLQNMKYTPDLDIVTFNLSEDQDWYYVSIELSGDNPNNSLGINYGVEIDLGTDGFGDFLIWAKPPYKTEWETSTVQVYSDSNHDSAGVSSSRSDAVFNGNGYDTLVFDGPTSQYIQAADPDLAWVRTSADPRAVVQFAFKKSLTGPAFMLGIVADAGLKDVSKFSYNDYFLEAEAGSPLRSGQYYPLGVVYAVDNTCWEAYNMQNLGFISKLCSSSEAPTTNRPQNDNSPSSTLSYP
ncbi:MAG TPA: hypothetical protein VJ785_07565 [Anaerolineales bacterium]|nr:hypothetical protein [Anaerolineales bacterium]